MAFAVTHCICYNKSFADLQAAMRSEGITTFEELKACALFGENCGRCVPYVREMIRTGETSFALFPVAAPNPQSPSQATAQPNP